MSFFSFLVQGEQQIVDSGWHALIPARNFNKNRLNTLVWYITSSHEAEGTVLLGLFTSTREFKSAKARASQVRGPSESCADTRNNENTATHQVAKFYFVHLIRGTQKVASFSACGPHQSQATHRHSRKLIHLCYSTKRIAHCVCVTIL